MLCPRCSGVLSGEERQCPHCRAAVQPPLSEAPTEPSPVRSDEHLELLPGGQFSARFLIIEKASSGGMGVVYKALDKILEQQVALKLLHPNLARDPAYVARFKREVRVTRQITHPNVCRVHDLGESDGILYLSMEWINGETLDELLSQAGKLDKDRALEIAEKVAWALDAAHSKGIIHRDLKPGNVMIDGRGKIFVLDFGLATEPGSRGLTEPGIRQGTPLYMAPEQLWGADTDARADLYALGLILEQMLTGQPPAPGPRTDGRLHARVGGNVAPVLEKLLANDRAERYPTARSVAEVLRDLRPRGARAPPRSRWAQWARDNPWSTWLAVGVLGLGIVLAAALFRGRLGFEPPASEARVYYNRGLYYLREEAETLQSLDGAIRMFYRALSADSSFALAWAGLGEAYWTRFDRFDRSGQGSSRDEAVRAVRRAFELEPSLPEAHNARARGLIAEGKYREAKEELRKALERKPNFDAAWANLGRAHQALAEYAEGLAALKRAIRINPTSFRHYVSLGNFHQRSSELDEAEKAYRKAIDLKPDSPIAWRNLGGCLLYRGEAQKAADALSQSLRLEENARSHTNLGIAYQYMNRYDDAAKQFRRATELEPEYAGHWGGLGDALTLLGRDSEAHEAYLMAVLRAREKVKATPLDPLAHSSLAAWCAKARDLQCASSEGARALEMRPGSADVLFSNAVVQCLEGRDDEALELLEKARKLGLGRAEIEHDPALLRLHQDPRFRRILELTS